MFTNPGKKITISAAECPKCADLKDTKLHCGESDLTGSFLQVHVLFCTRSYWYPEFYFMRDLSLLIIVALYFYNGV